VLFTSQLNNASVPVLSGGSAVLLTAVPPGPCEIVVSNTCGVTVYLGTTATVATTTGFPIPNNAPPVAVRTLLGSTGGSLYVIPATGGSITGGVGTLVSTSH